MSAKLRKVLSLAITISLLFQQVSFAQIAAELNIANHLARMASGFAVEKFRPLHLRYFSYDSLNDNFKVLLDKGDIKKLGDKELQSSTQTLLNYFLVGVTLPDSMFWVNLRPDSESQIIDQYLEKTDVGKIMLEADLQLKKDTSAMTSPATPEGKEYWDRLYKKAAELYGYDNVTIPTLTRPWIVPGEIIVRESNDSAYVYKANLKVMLEQDYLKDSSVYNFKDTRSKALNEYSSELIRELIIPKLTKEVNSSKRYAPLRQVYYSLILSRWFKQKFATAGDTFRQGSHEATQRKVSPGFVSLINTKNLTNLISKDSWSKTDYFKQYQKSFAEGEYNIKEPVYTPTGQTIRSYFSGGLDLKPMFGNKASGTFAGSPISNKVLETGVLMRGDSKGVRFARPQNTVASPVREMNQQEKEFAGYLAQRLTKEAIDDFLEDKTWKFVGGSREFRVYNTGKTINLNTGEHEVEVYVGVGGTPSSRQTQIRFFGEGDKLWSEIVIDQREDISTRLDDKSIKGLDLKKLADGIIGIFNKNTAASPDKKETNSSPLTRREFLKGMVVGGAAVVGLPSILFSAGKTQSILGPSFLREIVGYGNCEDRVELPTGRSDAFRVDWIRNKKANYNWGSVGLHFFRPPKLTGQKTIIITVGPKNTVKAIRLNLNRPKVDHTEVSSGFTRIQGNRFVIDIGDHVKSVGMNLLGTLGIEFGSFTNFNPEGSVLDVTDIQLSEESAASPVDNAGKIVASSSVELSAEEKERVDVAFKSASIIKLERHNYGIIWYPGMDDHEKADPKKIQESVGNRSRLVKRASENVNWVVENYGLNPFETITLINRLADKLSIYGKEIQKNKPYVSEDSRDLTQEAQVDADELRHWLMYAINGSGPYPVISGWLKGSSVRRYLSEAYELPVDWEWATKLYEFYAKNYRNIEMFNYSLLILLLTDNETFRDGAKWILEEKLHYNRNDLAGFYRETVLKALGEKYEAISERYTNIFVEAAASPLTLETQEKVELAKNEIFALLKDKRSLSPEELALAKTGIVFTSDYSARWFLDKLAESKWTVKEEKDAKGKVRYYYHPFRLMAQVNSRTDMQLLKQLGAEGALVGHSETRERYQLRNKAINYLLKEAHRIFGNFNVMALGEPVEMRTDKGKLTPEGWEFLTGQINEGLSGLYKEQLKNTIVAYEPIWSIGPKALRSAKPEEAQEVHDYIRKFLPRIVVDIDKDKITIQYGGSMNAKNADGLMAKADVDGGLIDGASLTKESALGLIKVVRDYVCRQREANTFSGRIPTIGFNLKAEVGGPKMEAEYLKELMDVFKFIQDNLSDIDLENEVRIYFAVTDTEIPLFSRALKGENPIDLVDLSQAALPDGMELAVPFEKASSVEPGAHTSEVTMEALKLSGVRKLWVQGKVDSYIKSTLEYKRAQDAGLEVVSGTDSPYIKADSLDVLGFIIRSAIKDKDKNVLKNNLLIVPPALAREAYAIVKASTGSIPKAAASPLSEQELAQALADKLKANGLTSPVADSLLQALIRINKGSNTYGFHYAFDVSKVRFEYITVSKTAFYYEITLYDGLDRPLEIRVYFSPGKEDIIKARTDFGEDDKINLAEITSDNRAAEQIMDAFKEIEKGASSPLASTMLRNNEKPFHTLMTEIKNAINVANLSEDVKHSYNKQISAWLEDKKSSLLTEDIMLVFDALVDLSEQYKPGSGLGTRDALIDGILAQPKHVDVNREKLIELLDKLEIAPTKGGEDREKENGFSQLGEILKGFLVLEGYRSSSPLASDKIKEEFKARGVDKYYSNFGMLAWKTLSSINVEGDGEHILDVYSKYFQYGRNLPFLRIAAKSQNGNAEVEFADPQRPYSDKTINLDKLAASSAVSDEIAAKRLKADKSFLDAFNRIKSFYSSDKKEMGIVLFLAQNNLSSIRDGLEEAYGHMLPQKIGALLLRLETDISLMNESRDESYLNSALTNLGDLMEIVNNLLKVGDSSQAGISRLEDGLTGASSAVKTPETPGGIDFRTLPLTIQPMGSFVGLNFKLPMLSKAQLDKMIIDTEMQQIQNMVQSGILPSGERIKELIAACVQKKEINYRADSLLLCLIDICKLEEENAYETSPELREALVIVDSVSG